MAGTQERLHGCAVEVELARHQVAFHDKKADVEPEVWNRFGLALPWHWPGTGAWSRRKDLPDRPGRPVPDGLRALVEQLVRQNRRSGYRRIQSELSKRFTKPLAPPVSMISWPTCTG